MPNSDVFIEIICDVANSGTLQEALIRAGHMYLAMLSGAETELELYRDA